MARILLFGANGQLGRELRRSLLASGNLTALSRNECDIIDKDKITTIIRDLQPEIIVNSAAYTNVDKAEKDKKTAMLVNARAPATIAQLARENNALLVDYSTDYVFNGTKPGAYVETDIPDPVNVYGQSKLAGLQAIQQSGCRHIVFRVSWVYGRYGNNFVKTMLRLGKEKAELKIIADQRGSPTPANLIADVTAQAIGQIQSGRGEEGVYNLVPAGLTSWYGYAEAIFEHAVKVAHYKKPELLPIKTSEYASEYTVAAKRPLNSCLSTEKLERVFNVRMPEWQHPLKQIIEEIIAE
ncbi:MAG TPA: dTDP-4-dehydrorhamnose reductase [Gammaproteobacteria bacterium]|nr:dTDP-4-dehydrorhamnose reductase [Gammaproteobacteria bacterium]